MSNKEMMKQDDEENLYGDVIKNLKHLKNVDAPDNFEDNLFLKINSGNYIQIENRPVKIFIQKKLLPALAVFAAAIIVIFMIETQPSHPQDPFSVKPRVREDVIAGSENINKSVEDLARKSFQNNSTDQKPAAKLKERSNPKNNISDKNADAYLENSLTDAALTGDVKLSKKEIRNGLNFKQIYLDKKQRKELTVLKEKMENLYNQSRK